MDACGRATLRTPDDVGFLIWAPTGRLRGNENEKFVPVPMLLCSALTVPP